MCERLSRPREIGLGRPGEREREEEADRAGLGRAAGPAQKVGPRGGRWVWAGKLGLGFALGFAFSISLSLLFLIQTSLNSNKNLNSNHTQLKVCTSMNATQNLNL